MSLTLNMVGGAGGTPELQTKSVSITPSESQETEAVLPDTGYDGLAEVDFEVAAIPSTYVGSGITRRDSTDLTASGATVSVPSGYYENAASKAVASGTAGTPTATKGTVSSNAISVTPSVTNTAGYISGGTITGTAVSVAASELVSGTKTINANSTTLGANTDVTNYKYAKVQLSTSDAVLIVTVPKNSTVTATRSSITLTPTMWTTKADSNLACAVFIIASSQFSSSSWTVTATKDGQTSTGSIVINSAAEYDMELPYGLIIYWDGANRGGLVKGGYSNYTQRTVSFESDHIHFAYGGGSSSQSATATVITNSRFNVSDYKTVHVLMKVNERPTTVAYNGFGVLNASPTYEANDRTAYSALNNSALLIGENEYTLDITNVTGNYYIGVFFNSTSNANTLSVDVSRIWLSK